VRGGGPDRAGRGLHGLGCLEVPLLLILAWMMVAPAAQIEATRVPCPDGEGEVLIHRLIAQNTIGGWDSDGARYSGGGHFRAKSVSTCPSGLSLLGADMGRGLPPSMLAKVEPVLEQIRAEHPDTDLTRLPAHVRHGFAARIYGALDQPYKEAQLWLSASWLARDQGVGLFKGLDGPVMARLMLAAGDRQLKNDLKPDTRKQLTFNLAVVAARGGYPGVRDVYLKQVQAMDLTPEERERVTALSQAIPLEARYQDQAIQALTRTLADREGPMVWTATYQLADLLRRRGRTDKALGFYRAVVAQDQAPEALRELAAYFVEELEGGTPWEKKRFQQIGGLQAPE